MEEKFGRLVGQCRRCGNGSVGENKAEPYSIKNPKNLGSFLKDHIKSLVRKSFLEQLGKGFNSGSIMSNALMGAGG